MKPGDLVPIKFPGAVETKVRPAVVLSTEQYTAARRDVIVGIVTSQLPSSPGPYEHVLTDWASAGLTKPSAFRAYLLSRPTTEIRRNLGRVSDTDWQAIRQCVRVALAQ